LTGALVDLYYMSRMNAKPPPLPIADGSEPTAIEWWYRAALAKFWRVKKRGPTLNELAAWLKKSRTAAYSALVSLEHKGWVDRVPGTRTFRLRTPNGSK
jgi:hypothetical protein